MIFSISVTYTIYKRPKLDAWRSQSVNLKKKITFAYQSCMETWNGNCCDLQMLIEWDDFQF